MPDRPYFANTEDLAGLDRLRQDRQDVIAYGDQMAGTAQQVVRDRDAAQSGPIDRELSELEDHIAYLGSQIPQLAVILEPVLGEEPPEKSNDVTGTLRGPLSPVGERIRNARERLEFISTGLTRLTNRIEV